MKKIFNKFYGKLLRNELYRRMVKHDVVSYSAQSAYYLILAIFPFMILILMSLSAIGLDHIKNLNEMLAVLPKEISQVIKDFLISSKQSSNSLFSPLLITAILISSNAITSLVKAFNIANDDTEGRSYFKQKLLSSLFLILIIVIFTASLSISILGFDFINKILTSLNIKQISLILFNILTLIINFILYLSVIGLMYYVLPNKKVKFKEIIAGTCFAAPTLLLVTSLFGFVINNFTKYSLVYGSLTSIVMLLIWLFVCSLILIVGEEINVLIENKNNPK